MKREDPRDVVIFSAVHAGRYKALSELSAGSVVGTSSVRRAAQLRRRYPGLVFKDVRGNIDTRLKKVDEYEVGGYDCIILAAAGLLRMEFGGRIAQFLESGTEGGGLLHAVGQGALGLEAREADERTLEVLKSVIDEETMLATFAERSLMRMLEGGCSVPIGVETSWAAGGKNKLLTMSAIVVSLDGKVGVEGGRTEEVTTLEEAEVLGEKLAQDLVEKGAQRILDVINEGRSPTSGAVKVSDI
jgi:hydroxymethylbilane synthase